MKDKGALWALNGDGGGSSIIVDENGKGLNQAENIGVNERPVNHAVLVYLDSNKNESPKPPVTPQPPTEDWRITTGSECVDYLAKHGIVDSPEGWKTKMTEKAENWMVFKVLKEMHEQLTKNK